MFNPTRDEVRRFFSDTWRKYRAQVPLEGLESTATEVMLLHAEYHPLLDDPSRNLDRDYTPDDGELNARIRRALG